MKYLIIISIAGFLSFQSKNDLICWEGVESLKVEDFRGLDSSDSLASAIGMIPKPAALSVLEYNLVQVSYDSVNRYRYRGRFNRSLSWIDQEGSLLSHEQTHFNIQELVLRQTNKRLDSIFQYTGAKINYDSLKIEVGEELDSIDARFDSETVYGTYSVRNEKWVERIASELETLGEYGVACKPKKDSGYLKSSGN